ncbi:uncharacterized protein PSFLO_00122 [Pseudozyma flocculosa]|uniref:Uncharacterized protein n=1 Tax=Pseudozyma flocculosa TaxID=84751 RepID=A0A5C3EUG0_9BASI|nr:uncharacterized protein PSFLO_00122 [Pseudozyma flocculosa]
MKASQTCSRLGDDDDASRERRGGAVELEGGRGRVHGHSIKIAVASDMCAKHVVARRQPSPTKHLPAPSTHGLVRNHAVSLGASASGGMPSDLYIYLVRSRPQIIRPPSTRPGRRRSLLFGTPSGRQAGKQAGMCPTPCLAVVGYGGTHGVVVAGARSERGESLACDAGQAGRQGAQQIEDRALLRGSPGWQVASLPSQARAEAKPNSSGRFSAPNYFQVQAQATHNLLARPRRCQKKAGLGPAAGEVWNPAGLPVCSLASPRLLARSGKADDARAARARGAGPDRRGPIPLWPVSDFLEAHAGGGGWEAGKPQEHVQLEKEWVEPRVCDPAASSQQTAARPQDQHIPTARRGRRRWVSFLFNRLRAALVSDVPACDSPSWLLRDNVTTIITITSQSASPATARSCRPT